ncbi:MAG: hypothetical protein GTN80_08220 [Nitrososphaeria archaeon]|nr:hypothetical protein [Nitrososphaeria archaeon]NIQ33608.1 hypothetical protein [Nitrososphaeria archaeon]
MAEPTETRTVDLRKIRLHKTSLKILSMWQRIRRLLAPGRRPNAENFSEKQLLMAILEMQIKIYDELRIANKDLMLDDKPNIENPNE